MFQFIQKFAILFLIFNSELYSIDYQEYLDKANKGDVYSMAVVGHLLRRGEYVEKNIEESFSWTITAAQSEEPIALYNLGNFFASGDLLEKSQDSANSCFLRAFSLLKAKNKEDDPISLYCLALLYYKENNSVYNKFKAFDYMLESAKLDYSGAQFYVGKMYEMGDGTEMDIYKAIDWYEEAADEGDTEALLRLGMIYFNGDKIVDDYKRSFKWFTKAANRGNPEAEFMLAKSYYYGYGTEQNNAKAFEWYKKSALNDYPVAQEMLGELYFYGYGTPVNYSEAFDWYWKAAENEIDQAQLMVAYMIQEKLIHVFDYSIIEKYYKKLIDKGNLLAMNNLATFYYNQPRLQFKKGEAVKLFNKAADLGSELAQYNYAKILNDKESEFFDPVNALAYYLLVNSTSDNNNLNIDYKTKINFAITKLALKLDKNQIELAQNKFQELENNIKKNKK